MPQSLYKYLSADSAAKVLENRTLRWATPGTFNDPADMQIDLACDFDQGEAIDLTLEFLWRRCQGGGPPALHDIARLIEQKRETWLEMGEAAFRRDVREIVKQTLQVLPEQTRGFSAGVREMLTRCKVICFSERRDSNLMWSHYGESHAGAVLEFRDAEGLDSPYKLARPIQYSDRPPQIFEGPEEFARFIAGDAPFPKDIGNRMIYTKSADWVYEREWRISAWTGREPDSPVEYSPFSVEELHAIYFGCKASEGTRVKLTELVKVRYPRAQIWNCRRDEHGYALRFELDKSN